MGSEFGNFIFGVIVSATVCYLFYIWMYALCNNRRFKRLIGIECVELTKEDKETAQNEINGRTCEFVQEWQEGSYTFSIPLNELKLDGYDEGVEDELDSMDLDERITMIEITEDYLIIEVNKFDLLKAKKEQLDEWIKEGQQDRADYWRDRGIV